MQVVTSGYAFLDIDAYGGMIAYAELLRLQGVEAIAATTAPLNESISPTVRSWPTELVTDYRPVAGDQYVLIDISEADYFDKFVVLDQVAEVIDHHPGFEAYWHERIGDAAIIDFIGAACTLVYERWVAAGLLDKMSATSARLLICGILDNTLNFGARVTTERDRQAYAALMRIADLPEDWPAQYFAECQRTILRDLPAALRADTKTIDYRTFGHTMAVGQLLVWDVSSVLAGHADDMQQTVAAVRPDWFINLISVGESKSYLYTRSNATQQWLSDLLGVMFTVDSGVAMADRMWLRKEISKRDLERASSPAGA